MPMLAHGENLIGPVLVLFFVFYPFSIWILVKGLSGKRSRFIAVCGAVVALVGGVGTVLVIKGFLQDLYDAGPSLDDLPAFLVGLAFWVFPLLCGIIALRKTWWTKDPEKERLDTPAHPELKSDPPGRGGGERPVS
jgi:hypothetical protein